MLLVPHKYNRFSDKKRYQSEQLTLAATTQNNSMESPVSIQQLAYTNDLRILAFLLQWQHYLPGPIWSPLLVPCHQPTNWQIQQGKSCMARSRHDTQHFFPSLKATTREVGKCNLVCPEKQNRIDKHLPVFATEDYAYSNYVSSSVYL